MPDAKRQLAAIMFTDIVGYTAMMQQDEKSALTAVRKHEELLTKLVPKYNGQIQNLMGDGSLCLFNTATAAIRCAKEIQLQINDGDSVPLKIGVHDGEIILEGNQARGDAINIASRIQDSGHAGAILFSQSVNNKVSNQRDLKSKSVGLFQFKNVDEPIELFILIDNQLPPLNLSLLKNRLDTEKTRKTTKYGIPRSLKAAITIVLISAIIIFSYRYIKKQNDLKWAYQTGIPQIENHIKNLVFAKSAGGTGPEAWSAFELVQQVEKIISDDPKIEELKDKCSLLIDINSNPSGVKVYAKPYSLKDTAFQLMGITPLINTRIPSGNISLRLEKEGYETITDFIFVTDWLNPTLKWNYTMEKQGSIPENMIMVRPHMDTVILRWVFGIEELLQNPDAFLVDKYEVSNKEFKAFIMVNGYENQKYWKEPFVKEGLTLTRQQAMSFFVDQTSRPGPSSWFAGNYPEGEDDYPVSGVSWYEAMAYAEYANKQLPSVTHFKYLSGSIAIHEISKKSNLHGLRTWKRKKQDPQNLWGVHDLQGNVREWCYNEYDSEDKSILGGAYNDDQYLANDFTQDSPPFHRDKAYGFRCVKIEKYDDYTHPLYRKKSVGNIYPDYYVETPVNDEILDIYLKNFAYDKIELIPEILYEKEEEYWIKQKVQFNAAYRNEKVTAYLFLPKNTKPPYQTIIYWPGADAMQPFSVNSERDLQIGRIEFFIKNGRALIYPIYSSTYERGSAFGILEKFKSKDQVIEMIKDLKKSVDYLETREDIDIDKLAYYGISWGASLGGMAIVAEQRIKIGIFTLGGFFRKIFRLPPEVDPFNYIPRVKVPVIHFNGRYDNFKESSKPYFDFMGSKDKEMFLSDNAHFVPQKMVIKESLIFLDKHFGPVEYLNSDE